MRAKLARTFLLAAVAAGLGAAATAQDKGVSITDIRQENTERSTRIVIECSGPLAYTYYSPDPLTLVVDVPEMAAGSIPSRINVGTREVESLRVTQMARADGRSLARIEVRLASLVPYQVFSKDRSLNLVFERSAVAQASSEPQRPEPRAEAPVKSETITTPVAPELNAPVEPAPSPAAQAGHRTTEAAKAAAPGKPVIKATRILGVTSVEENGQLSVTIRADGALKYQDFFLGNPDRLVIDFKDVTSRAPYRADVQHDPVRSVRLGQFSAANPKVARLVLDLATRKPYRILEGDDGVKIVFGEGRTPAQAPLAAPKAALAPMTEPAAALVAPRLMAPGAAPAVLEVQAPAAAPRDTSAAPGAEPRKWSGHPVSFDFKEGDLQDIFRLMAEISGLNVVVNPGISGRVTLKLTEVPWDQALDLILKINGLGHAIEDNVLRIAKLTDMQREESDRRKLAEEKALAGDLADWSKRIYYAKALDLQDVIKKSGALSARGQINIDVRTNTLLMKDLPQYIDKAKLLVGDLDVATPQVEIEARIVVTSRNFTRDIGIQWGFLNQQTYQFGNTTDKAFPNAIILNGQGVPGAGLPAGQSGLAPAAGIGTAAGRGYAVNLPASGFTSALGVSMGNILGNFNLDLALTALERQGRGRLLSTPKVTTQNNQEATIKQGVQIPIQTVANNTVTVSFKDAVLTLKVTPQISEAGTVILALSVENNAADFANLVNGIPPINTQSATTNVLVHDGATAVIGGIYQSQEQQSQSNTPVLGRIPILGYLFKQKFNTSQNNELLLFVTPRIIKG